MKFGTNALARKPIPARIHWILLPGFSIIASLMFSLPMMLGANLDNPFVSGFAIVGFLIALAFACSSFRILVRQPARYLHWSLRPEWIVRLVTGGILIACWFGTQTPGTMVFTPALLGLG